MLLQEEASSYFERNGWNIKQSYFLENVDHNHIPTALLMKGIINDLKQKKSISFIAAKFHYSLVNLIDILAMNAGINKLAFSGGVFLNSVLIDLLHYHLSKKYNLYFHKELSPNDENISFGQMVYYDNKIKEGKNRKERNEFISNYENEIV